MSEEKPTKETEVQVNLFQELLAVIGKLGQEQNLSLIHVLGTLTLLEKHLIENVVASHGQASAQPEGDDTPEKTVSFPDGGEDKA
tara:strand:+ start:715 stop:969 length:255 start_codon:yes stop_codon:yes gene_type:complete